MQSTLRLGWLKSALAKKVLGASSLASLAAWVLIAQRVDPPRAAAPLDARLELAAGEVAIESAGQKVAALSGTPVPSGATLSTGSGARALARLGDGSALFLRES